MAVLTPTKYSTGKDAYLYKESQGELKAQLNGVIALCGVFLVLCWATFGARIYVRAYMLKGLKIDDWWLVATMIVFTVYAALLIFIAIQLYAQVPGYAAGEVPTTLEIPHMVVAGYCLYSVITIFFKFSLGYFFLGVFDLKKRLRIIIWVSMVLPGVLGIVNIAFTSAYPCQLMSVFFAGLPTCGEFVQRTDWAIIAALWAGVSAITDLIYGVLAFKAISALQMPARRRLTAAVLCSLGCIGGVAACVRLAFLIATVPGLSVLGGALHTAIWSVIEPGVAIVAAAVSTLRPLYLRWKDPNWTMAGTSSGHSGVRSHITSRSVMHRTREDPEADIQLVDKDPKNVIRLQVDVDQYTSD